jgi:ATP-dependent Clp protease ATP-binding subunit ClpC
VRRKPYSVVLLDEIEKAHPDIFNLMLQALDEGHMTDSLGRKVDFKNTLIIMTSNIGSRQLKDFGAGVGFGTKTREDNADDLAKGVIESALKKAFAPEFLNRIDDVIVFNPLEKADISRIVKIEAAALIKRMAGIDYELHLTDEAVQFIGEKGYDPKYGARPLARAIQKFVEDPLAEEIVKGLAHPGDSIHFSVEADAEKLSLSIKKQDEASPTQEVKPEKKAKKQEEDSEPAAEATAEEDLEGK